MFCNRCGASVADGVRFCTECGAPMGPVRPKCPWCGEELEADSVFCSGCGRRLTAQAAPAAGYTPVRPAGYAQPAASAGRSAARNAGGGENRRIFIAVGAVLAGLLLVFALWRFFSGREESDPAATAEAVPAAAERQTEGGTSFALPQPEIPALPGTEPPESEPAGEPMEEPAAESEPEPEPEAEPENEQEPEAEPENGPQPEQRRETEPASPPLPYAESLGRPMAEDFAWITDVQTGDLTGDFLGNDELVGKWKAEIIYAGVWELAIVTIDTNGGIAIEPCEVNFGEGWEDETGTDPYLFDGRFDVSSVYGEGRYGSIDLYLFLESHGIQYGVGTFNVHDEETADVYLVRP